MVQPLHCEFFIKWHCSLDIHGLTSSLWDFFLFFFVFIKWHWRTWFSYQVIFLWKNRSFENKDSIKTFPCQRKDSVKQKKVIYKIELSIDVNISEQQFSMKTLNSNSWYEFFGVEFTLFTFLFHKKRPRLGLMFKQVSFSKKSTSHLMTILLLSFPNLTFWTNSMRW